MSKIKVAIVEDDFIISHDISANLQELGYEVTGIYESGTEAIAGIRRDTPDIILMDINLKGGIDGIETTEIIRNTWDIPVIYITGSTDRSTLDRAKKTLPHAFIIKPFSFSSLGTTIEFAVYNYTNNLLVNIKDVRQQPGVMDEDHINRDMLFVKEKGRLVKVLTSDFYFMSAKGSYCEIITANKKFTVSRNLQSLMDKLNPNTFMRVHRSHAVNINKIDSIYDNEIEISGTRIPINKTAKTELLERINAL